MESESLKAVRSKVKGFVEAEEALRVAQGELRAEVAKLRESNVQVFDQLPRRDTSLQPARSGWPVLSIRASLALRDFDDTLEELSDDDAAAYEGLGNLSLRIKDNCRSKDRFRFPV
ncbi:hypothetical protein CTI12_AA439210 [Artemisia annua]|uniref:Uncharacterized protein n=1 Tax=Artemisia annua TaxID=35608 RepID=A0A2U1LYP4_ARTAN|nr:hypothetical protein CTI12_AA439210 [Artemisia annua]